MHDRHRMREREKERQREKQTPCGGPDAGLDPRALGSRPEPKTEAQPLSYPGAPGIVFKVSQVCSQG